MMTEMTLQQAYDALGVSRADDFAAIRAVWVRKVKTFHPDVWHGNTQQATRRLMRLNDAYDLLSRHHTQQRAAYEAQQKADAKAAAKAYRAAPKSDGTSKPKATDLAMRPRPAPARRSGQSPVAKDFAEARRIFGAQATPRELAVL